MEEADSTTPQDAPKPRNWWKIALVTAGVIVAIPYTGWRIVSSVEALSEVKLLFSSADGTLQLPGGLAELTYNKKFLDSEDTYDIAGDPVISVSPMFSASEWLDLSTFTDPDFKDFDDPAVLKRWLASMDQEFPEAERTDLEIDGLPAYQWDYVDSDGSINRDITVPVGDRYVEAECLFPEGSDFADRCLAALKTLQVRYEPR